MRREISTGFKSIEYNFTLRVFVRICVSVCKCMFVLMYVTVNVCISAFCACCFRLCIFVCVQVCMCVYVTEWSLYLIVNVFFLRAYVWAWEGSYAWCTSVSVANFRRFHGNIFFLFSGDREWSDGEHRTFLNVCPYLTTTSPGAGVTVW